MKSYRPKLLREEKRRWATNVKLFLSQLVWKSLVWIVFGFCLGFLGGLFGNKYYISRDILGEIYQFIAKSRNIKVEGFFLGEKIGERQKLLFCALIFLVVFIFLNATTSLSNLTLKLRDKYVENNNFYIYNKWIFFFNSLARIISYIIVTLCFVSFQTIVLIFLFTSFYTWFSNKILAKTPRTENFFTWEDPCIRRILISSTLVIILLPIIYDWIITTGQVVNQQTSSGSFSKLKDLFNNLVNSIPLLKLVFDSLKEISSFVHWIILFWFIRAVIFSRIGEYEEFWNKKIAPITKQATDFKQFYYYQHLLSEVKVVNQKFDLPAQTKKIIISGNYGFLQITPIFLKKQYLEKKTSESERNELLSEFNQEIEKVIEFIDFLPKNLNPGGKDLYKQKEVNFLIYCLFNECQSLEEMEKTKQLIILGNK